jgi:hypothetical protein
LTSINRWPERHGTGVQRSVFETQVKVLIPAGGQVQVQNTTFGIDALGCVIRLA